METEMAVAGGRAAVWPRLRMVCGYPRKADREAGGTDTETAAEGLSGGAKAGTGAGSAVLKQDRIRRNRSHGK